MLFLEGNNIVAGFVPVDMQAAANAGQFVSLANFERALAILFKAAGTAGDDPVFTLEQAQDLTGTGVKALNFTTIFSKVGAIATTKQFTKITQASANTYVDTVSAENPAVLAVEILAEQLDVNNGFTCVRLRIPDTGGNAQLGCALYLMLEPHFAGEPSQSAQG